MIRTIAIYGAVLAFTAILLEWLQYRAAMRMLDPDYYAIGLALTFTAIGIWVGLKLTRRREHGAFQPNAAAIAALGISAREAEVLKLVAAGHSNKEIARLLTISPNTVKTHVAAVFGKLEATRRTQAVEKARSLQILP